MTICSTNSRCENPTIVETDDEKFCFNCYESFKKSEEKPIKTKLINTIAVKIQIFYLVIYMIFV